MARARKDWKEQPPEDEQPTDIEGLLKWMDELMADVPEEELAKVPTDLSVNFDYYAYGHKKQQP